MKYVNSGEVGNIVKYPKKITCCRNKKTLQESPIPSRIPSSRFLEFGHYKSRMTPNDINVLPASPSLPSITEVMYGLVKEGNISTPPFASV